MSIILAFFLLSPVATLVAPSSLPAQEARKVCRIGFLRAGQPPTTWVETFRQGLREQGYVEGQNVVLEFRHGSLADLPQLAEELVRLKVDVILADQIVE